MEVPFVILLCVVYYVGNVDKVFGQSKLIDPPNRSSMWRYGFSTPQNIHDGQLNCGGINTLKANEAKCGLCGDSWSSLPRPNENKGTYATKTISRNYTQGQLVTFSVQFLIGHKGHFEFRLCNLVSGIEAATQQCFNQHLLTLANGSSKLYVGSTRFKNVTFDMMLPPTVSCERCVIQWTYITAHMWGCNKFPKKCCFGCGLQERYVNCADVRIEPLPTTTETQPTTTPALASDNANVASNVASTAGNTATKTELTTPTPTPPLTIPTPKPLQELIDAQRTQLETLTKLKTEMNKLQKFHSAHESVPTAPVKETTIPTEVNPVALDQSGQPANLQEFVKAFLSVTNKINGQSQSSALSNILGNVELFHTPTSTPTPPISNAEQFLQSMFFSQPETRSETPPVTYPQTPPFHNYGHFHFNTPMHIQAPIDFRGQPPRQGGFNPYLSMSGFHSNGMMPPLDSGHPMSELLGLSELSPSQQSMFGMNPMTSGMENPLANPMENSGFGAAAGFGATGGFGANSGFGEHPMLGGGEAGSGGAAGAGGGEGMMNNMMMELFRKMLMQNNQSPGFPLNMASMMNPASVSAPVSLPPAPVKQKPLTIDTITDVQRTAILEKLKLANEIMSKQVPPIGFNEKLKAYRMVIDASLSKINEERNAYLAPNATSNVPVSQVVSTAPAVFHGPQVRAPVQQLPGMMTAGAMAFTEMTQNQQLLTQQQQISELQKEIQRLKNLTNSRLSPVKAPPRTQRQPSSPMSEVAMLESLLGMGALTQPKISTGYGGNWNHPMHTAPVDFNNVDPFTLMGMGGSFPGMAGIPGMSNIGGGFSLFDALMKCDYIGIGEIEWPCRMYCNVQSMNCVAKAQFPQYATKCQMECAVL